ncbi:MAG: protein phosphatase CheZ [Candidatus Zixiibacteriota bacterium]
MAQANKLQQKIQEEIADLTRSINDIIKNFKELKNPLQESQDKVPLATNQLDKISEQTEAATHHMLDLIEGVSVREEEMISGLKELKRTLGDKNGQVVEVLDRLLGKAETNINDAFTIMNALQFQDITSQQVNHAAALLEEIESKLRLIQQFFGAEPDIDEIGKEPEPRKERVYDPHADLYEKKTQQEEVDSLFDQVKHGNSK